MSLEQLKTIRSRRMEQRFVELQEQRRVLQEQQQHLQQKEQQLVHFGQWRLGTPRSTVCQPEKPAIRTANAV